MLILSTLIDLQFELPNIDQLSDWIDDMCLADPKWWSVKAGYHRIALAATREHVDDWRSPMAFKTWQESRYELHEDYNLKYSDGLLEIFPGLETLLTGLPFDQIGAVGLMKQLDEVPLHMDTTDHTYPIEPRRYVAYLTDPNENTFYINHNGQNYDVPVLDNYRVFSFNSVDAKHGARRPVGAKIIVSVVGVINHDKHKKLLNHSLEKFSDYVVKSHLTN